MEKILIIFALVVIILIFIATEKKKVQFLNRPIFLSTPIRL